MRVQINFNQEEERTLDELIPTYAQNKLELESYKKICESENSAIKEKLLEIGQDEYSAGGYKAKRSVSERVSINEDKLLAVMKKHYLVEVIKTREYVDMDALENYLYHADENDLNTQKLLEDIDKCRDVKEVVTLRVSKERSK